MDTKTVLNQQNPAEHVGRRLKQLRQERGISMRELGRKSGISANALSMIERGLTSPSVSTLYRLTDALNLPITALFRWEQAQEPLVFRSVENRTRIPFPSGIWEGLGGEAFIGRMQPFLLTLESGAKSGKGKIVHTGHEFVMCLEGRLEYEVEGRVYYLNAGESLLFAARLIHRWRNPGETVSKVLIVLSGFDDYETPGAFHISQHK